MDPISQGVVGGSASLSVANKAHLLIAVICGVLAGMAPDLDALIRSETDPLLYLEFHRQFTHSLLFIPAGALICAGVFHYTFARKLPFKLLYMYCTAGYATHGLLDSCTTYGTQLFWPFSDARVAWHSISIIDPLFTLPLMILVGLGALKRSRVFGYIAVGWALGYLSFGGLQGHRASQFGEQLAQSRGHQPSQLESKPSFGNLLLWKTIYTTHDRYYVDAVRVGLKPIHYPGESVKKLSLERDLPWLTDDSQQAKDVERFRWFSNNYLALSDEHENFIVDMRYSLLPNEVDGLWGIQLDPHKGPHQHAEFIWDRKVTKEKRQSLVRMIRGLPIEH
ncbi:MAG: metal-dependent hydrolase [Gammaproteobacteria bacterium]